MNTTHSFDGYWYLPGKVEHQIAGQLTVEESGSITLKIFGSFKPLKEIWNEIAFLKENEKVIWGTTIDNKHISLIQCSGRHQLNSDVNFCIITYQCKYAFVGKHIESLEEKGRYEAYATNDILKHWCHPQAIGITHYTKDQGKALLGKLAFDFERCINEEVIQSVHISSDEIITLKRDISYQGSFYGYDHEIHQKTNLCIEANNHSPYRILEIFRTFEKLLELATLQRISPFKIIIKEQENIDDDESTYNIANTIQVFTNSPQPDSKSKFDRINFLFTYDSISEAYADIIKQWFGNDTNIIQIRNHLIDSITAEKVFSSTSFLIVAQAIDGFWQRFREDKYRIQNNIKHKTRLSFICGVKELYEEFKDNGYIAFTDDDFLSIADSRDFYSHLLPIGKKKHVKEGTELFILYHTLRKLLICCTLDFLGVSKQTIKKIFLNSNSFITRKEVRFI